MQLPLAELGKPSPNIDLFCTTGSNGRAIFHCLTLTYNPRLTKVEVDSHAKNRRSKVKRFKQESAHKRTDVHTHAHIHGRYQTYYLSCYAFDNNRQTIVTSLVHLIDCMHIIIKRSLVDAEIVQNANLGRQCRYIFSIPHSSS